MLEKQLKAYINLNISVVIDDLRFVSEAQMLSNYNTHIFRLNRNGTFPGSHQSAREYLQIPAIDVNNNNDPIATYEEILRHIND